MIVIVFVRFESLCSELCSEYEFTNDTPYFAHTYEQEASVWGSSKIDRYQANEMLTKYCIINMK